jgi:protein involved in polysaccharide export with SLBB domain
MFKVPNEYQYATFKPNEKEYKIQPFDKLDVKVFYNNGVNLIESQSGSMMQTPIEYNVEYDGLVKLPSLGRVALAGLTIRQAEELFKTNTKS